MLVSKVVQNLANGVEFGEKEGHMTIINPFVKNNVVILDAFFQQIVSEYSNEVSYPAFFPLLFYLF